MDYINFVIVQGPVQASVVDAIAFTYRIDACIFVSVYAFDLFNYIACHNPYHFEKVVWLETFFVRNKKG